MSRFPTYFLVIVAIYLAIFFLYLGYFVIPGVSYNLFKYEIFYLILFIVFLPLILFLFYIFDKRFPSLKRHESLMRIAITVFSLISIVFFLLLMPVV